MHEAISLYGVVRPQHIPEKEKKTFILFYIYDDCWYFLGCSGIRNEMPKNKLIQVNKQVFI